MSGNYWIWIDGRPVPAAEARVPVLDRGFLYGDSVYEVTRTVGQKPLFYELHRARLASSAAGIGMTLPRQAEIDAAVSDTIQAAAVADSAPDSTRPPVEGGRDFYLRIIVTRGGGELDLDPAAADAPRLLVLVKPLAMPNPQLYREGASLATVSQRRNAPGHVPPEVKSGNYLSSVLALSAARRRGAYEALMLDLHGQLCEGASSNFFAVIGGRLCTPPRSAGILAGITRGVLLKLASGHGIPVSEEPLSLVDALAAEEAMITSSIRGVMPVTTIDKHPIGSGRPGPITRRLMHHYDKLIGELR
jgi:branched-chain amino acid aminotransferase